MSATTKTWQGPQRYPMAGTVVYGYSGWDLVLEIIPADDPRIPGWMGESVKVVACDETGQPKAYERPRVHCTNLIGQRVGGK